METAQMMVQNAGRASCDGLRCSSEFRDRVSGDSISNLGMAFGRVSIVFQQQEP